MNDCDKCGLEPYECHCYVHELEERISALEDGLDALTDVVNIMSEEKDYFDKLFKENFAWFDPYKGTFYKLPDENGIEKECECSFCLSVDKMMSDKHPI